MPPPPQQQQQQLQQQEELSSLPQPTIVMLHGWLQKASLYSNERRCS